MTKREGRRLAVDAGKYFTPNAPIDRESLFAGRSEQILRITDAVHQKGQHVVLFGERGVGKTSLASIIPGYLDQQSTLSIRVNCDSSDSFSSVWQKVFGEVVLVAERQVPGFGSQVEKTAVPVGEQLHGKELTAHEVRKALQTMLGKATPVVVVDEFDRLPGAAKSSFADLTKMLSDFAVQATLVLVGLGDSVDEVIAEHRSVERALAQIRLPRMSEAEIDTILDNGLTELGLRMEQSARDRIVQLAQGLPHYAHLLALHAVRAAAAAGRAAAITAGDLDRGIRAALQGVQQSVRSAYVTATSSPRPNTLHEVVLCACAVARIDELGFFAAADVRDSMRQITGRAYEIPSFARHLSQFCSERRGRILTRRGKPRRYRYRFRNPLVQPFVIMQGLDSGVLSPGSL